MDHDEFEYKTYKEICNLIVGCHFTKEEVERMKYLLDGSQIIDPNFVRDWSFLND